MALATLDWLILAAYVGVVLLLGWRLGRGDAGARDYFLAGRSAPAWAVGLSIVATQAGAISLIGAPAFVALHPEGGLRWLQYELAVPIAMMVLLVTLVPHFHRSGVVSVYEHLERRFDRRTRTAVSLAFQASRALATGIAIYALAIVLSVALEWPLAATILAVGGITLAYDVLGGMRGVIATDVLQIGFIVVGLGAAVAVLLSLGGGFDALVGGFDAARARTLDIDATGVDGNDFGFWPMLLGGLFLYVAYYGTDQSQVQRLLSARDENAARRALVVNGLVRFPLVLAYTLFGVLLAGFVATRPDFAAKLPDAGIDYLVPVFIVEHMPAGAAGILVVAVLAAAMSSLDSALNSLSAATVEDIVTPRLARPLSPRASLRLARAATFAWGAACTGFALAAASFSAGVLETINMVGSLFYGPILAVFALGFASRRAPPAAAVAALVAGLALNLALWLAAPQVSWLWWNAFGFGGALSAGFAWRLARPGPPRAREMSPSRIRFGRGWLALSLFFAAMLALTAALPRLLE